MSAGHEASTKRLLNLRNGLVTWFVLTSTQYKISKEVMDVVSSVRDCLKRWAKGGDSEW